MEYGVLYSHFSPRRDDHIIGTGHVVKSYAQRDEFLSYDVYAAGDFFNGSYSLIVGVDA